MGRRDVFAAAVVAAALLQTTSGPAIAQDAPQADVANVTQPPDTPAASPPIARTLAPFALPLRLPRDEVGLALSVSSVDDAVHEVTAWTGTLYLESLTEDERFALRLGLPLSHVEAFLFGDIDIDAAWTAYREVDEDGARMLVIAADATIPTNLLNTLGGNRDQIFVRRRSRYPDVTALNLLPIRYLQVMPHVGWMQRIGDLAFFADVGVVVALACQYANYYDSPRIEAALQYGAGAAYRLHDTDDLSVALGLELTGTHFLSTVAPVDVVEVRETRDTGLSIAPSARLLVAQKVAVDAGLVVALANEQTYLRQTPSTLWQHDFTFITQIGFLF